MAPEATQGSPQSIDVQAGDLFARLVSARERVAAGGAGQRRARLQALLECLMRRRADAHAALAADFRKAPAEVDLTELYPVITEIRQALRHMDRWMRPRRRPTALAFLGTTAQVVREPKGVVLILSPWNYPLYLTLGPLVSAVAAGNCALLKPSEFTPATTRFVAEVIQEVFPPDEVALLEGAAEAAQALLALPFDHVFFTGGPANGRRVMRAAAEHLASVTLELGGKSPVLVDADADLAKAARKIAWGKFLNGGQTCVAPDYVLVHQRVREALLEELALAVKAFYGEDAESRKASPDFPRIIHGGHLARLQGLLAASGGRVVLGGQADPGENYLAPTLVTDLDPESPIMQEEIFGPILPVLPVADMKAAVAFVNARPKPLALYYFGRSRGAADEVVRRTRAGGTCINEVVMHFAHPHLPAGGVGTSGFGKAHGEWGFLAFSNERALLRPWTSFLAIQLMYPPYTRWVRRLIDLTLKFF